MQFVQNYRKLQEIVPRNKRRVYGIPTENVYEKIKLKQKLQAINKKLRKTMHYMHSSLFTAKCVGRIQIVMCVV